MCFARVDKAVVSPEPGGTRGPKVNNGRFVSASQARIASTPSASKLALETDTNPSHSRAKLPKKCTIDH